MSNNDRKNPMDDCFGRDPCNGDPVSYWCFLAWVTSLPWRYSFLYNAMLRFFLSALEACIRDEPSLRGAMRRNLTRDLYRLRREATKHFAKPGGEVVETLPYPSGTLLQQSYNQDFTTCGYARIPSSGALPNVPLFRCGWELDENYESRVAYTKVTKDERRTIEQIRSGHAFVCGNDMLISHCSQKQHAEECEAMCGRAATDINTYMPLTDAQYAALQEDTPPDTPLQEDTPPDTPFVDDHGVGVNDAAAALERPNNCVQ
jgi:hypothetical protein